jgi:hypothetical protein
MFPSLDHAYCLNNGYATEIFFPDKDHKGAIAFAKSICAQCPVKLKCLNIALYFRIDDGIWGGLTENERRDLRVQEVLRSYSERNKKPHEQEHPLNASLVSPSHTSHSENHTLQVSHWRFVQRMASQVDGIEVSQLLSPGESSYHPNRSPLFERVLAEFEKIRRRFDQTQKTDQTNLIVVDPGWFQTGQSSVSSQQPQSDPNLLSLPDQPLESSLDFTCLFAS